MLFHEELFTRSQCTCCQQEISGLGIECLDCTNGIRLCCECFAYGAEIGQHKADHRYRFFDSGSLVLSLRSTDTAADTEEDEMPTWSAREEIRLLDAIEQYGFGNWQDISRHIETKKSQEAKREYVNRYVVGPLGELTWSTTTQNEVNRNLHNIQIQKPVDHTLPCEEGPLSPSLTQRLPPLEISADEMLQLGYMPNRDDYEKEYDNEAERLVSQLSFSPEDEDVDIALKLTLVDMYTRRLRERARRKRMIRDYQLVSVFFKKDRKNGDLVSLNLRTQFMMIEKDLKTNLKPFCQFLKYRECAHLMKNVVKEKELVMRMGELYKYRRNGIRRPEECAEYERLKGDNRVVPVRGKRPLDAIMEVENQEGRSGTKKAHLAEKLAAPLLVRQLQMALPNSPKAKATNSASGESAGASPSAGLKVTPQPSSREDSNSKSSTLELNESARASSAQGLLEAPVPMEVCLPPPSESSSQQKEKLKALGDQYTVELTPSADLLTTKELQFCSKTSFTPAQFLTLKTALLLARKPKTDNQQSMEIKEIQCPPNIRQQEWEKMITFFKGDYN